MSSANPATPGQNGCSEIRRICALIASTTAQTGLTVQCRPDKNTYEKGTKVSDEQMARLNIAPADFHGEWTYTIAPRKPER